MILDTLRTHAKDHGDREQDYVLTVKQDTPDVAVYDDEPGLWGRLFAFREEAEGQRTVKRLTEMLELQAKEKVDGGSLSTISPWTWVYMQLRREQSVQREHTRDSWTMNIERLRFDDDDRQHRAVVVKHSLHAPAPDHSIIR